MEFLAEYGMFLAKTITFVFFVLLLLRSLFPLGRKIDQDQAGHLEVSHLNERYARLVQDMSAVVLDKKKLKHFKKEKKKAKKAAAKQHKDDNELPGRVYYLTFKGDISAKAVSELRQEITAVIGFATPKDEVVVNIESTGGLVHGYGLASSQLRRLKQRNIPLTISVDKVAASGGYMMASVGDKILAAPFAIVGSIGVVAQLPNFHRLLKKNDIDFELHTAGAYKRTLTMFGENMEKDREKFVQDLEETHTLFKQLVSEYRPDLDMDQVATGEFWFGKQALDKGLVDELSTSDEYLVAKMDTAEVYAVRFVPKKSLQEKFAKSVDMTMEHLITRWVERIRSARYWS